MEGAKPRTIYRYRSTSFGFSGGWRRRTTCPTGHVVSRSLISSLGGRGRSLRRGRLAVARDETRRTVAVKTAIEPTVSTSTRANDASKISAQAVLGVVEVVEGVPPVLALSMFRASQVCRPVSPRIDAPNSTPVGVSTAATFAMAAAFRERGPGKQSTTPFGGRMERPLDGERLEHIGLDGRDVQPLQPPRRVVEDVPVGVEEGDRTPIGQARPFEEVSRTGTDVEVPRTDVLSVSLHEARRRAAPHWWREHTEDQVVGPAGTRDRTLVGRRRRGRHGPSNSGRPPS